MSVGDEESMNRDKRRMLFRMPLMRSAAVSAVMAVACGVVLAVILSAGLTPPPSFEEVRHGYAQSEGVILDRRGQVIHEMRLDNRTRRLRWVPLEEVSPALCEAVVQAEDWRFFRHRGVDWKSLAGAVAGLLRSNNRGGASTLTMQVASKLYPELEPRGLRRSPLQKLRQVRAAVGLERRWMKSQILEAYLNLVTFRGELAGIAAASAGLFGKRPHGLDRCESVILAVLVRAPNASADAVEGRAALLAAALGWEAERSQVAAKVQEALRGPYLLKPQAQWAPHVAARLLGGRTDCPDTRSCQVLTTIDGDLQRFAVNSLRHHILAVRSKNVNDGAVVVLENVSGDVLAYVGNPGEVSSARFVDGVTSPRQAGSALKPFLYSLAFDRRLLTAASLIEDSPVDIPVPGGVYRPRNYDNRFHGLVTARTALASSLNVPAVKVLNLVGVDAFVEALTALGFGGLRTPDFYGPSLALGSADIRLWDLVNAYRTLANGGTWSPTRLTPGANDAKTRRRVLSESASFLVSDILSDRESRSATFALEGPLSTRFWTAVKTGTSKDMRDNWCVGYSDRYTVGVWIGNFSGEPMWDVSGVTGAAPVWLDIMQRLHRSDSSAPRTPPPGVVSTMVELKDMGRTRPEWFLSGTETPVISSAPGALQRRIRYPAQGTIIALDPDIPEGMQRIFFEADAGTTGTRWDLDGQSVGTADTLVFWGPKPGRHRLSLLDDSDRVLDSVEFEVRGSLP